MPITAERIQDVFLAASEIRDPAERSRFLDGACGGDTGLKSRVEALLLAHDHPDSLLDRPAVAGHDLNNAETQTLGQENAMSADDEVPLGFLEPATRPDSLGRIGHYEVLQVLGKGGFGIVFRAFDEVLHRVVAVKVLSPQIASTSPARKRFLREARSSAAVRHENVVQVHEVGEQPLPYIVMEFIPGETLQQRLDRIGPFESAEVVRIGRQIAEGLAAAHATDLIHRDIKPGNILLEGGHQKVKITDFGLARAADDASISQSGLIAGTPMYMAPEQAKGEALDQRADLFSLGSVLYVMAAGRPPFRANGTLAVLKRVAEDMPRPIREIIPETPQWLCDLISKLHAKNPADRFQSAREVADVLTDCEAQLKTNSKLKDFSRIPPPRPVANVTPRKFRKARPKLALFCVLVSFLVFAVWLSPAAVRYASNQGELEILPQEGLVSVIVLHNDEGVLDANKLHAPVTDWLGMKEKSQTVKLSPGRYQLNVGTWPEGTSVSQWEVTTSSLFGSNSTMVPVVNTSAIITVERGQRLTLRPKMRVVPQPVPVATPEPLSPTFKNDLGMEFAIVPKGKSWLGGGKDKPGDKEVEIPADFYLGKYEVTQEEWQKVTGKNPSAYSRKGGYKDAVKDVADADLKRFPVEYVSWDQCQTFVDKLNKLERESGWEYRLPTGEEWEYACRGGPMAEVRHGTFDFYFVKPTNNLLPAQANFNNGLPRPCKVGSYEPNVLGLHDMHGNVGEWCEGAETRGGGWNLDATSCRAASSSKPIDGLGNNGGLGLRLARVRLGVPPPEVKTPPSSLPTTFKNTLGMEFAIVPKGKSWLGGGKDKPGDNEVVIPADFYLGKYEVTQEEWEKVMGENPSHFSRNGLSQNAVKDINDAGLKRLPVENVSWDQCQLFIATLNNLEKESGWVYRLPKEMEWEYACRGGPMSDKLDSAFAFYFAKPTNTLLPEQANFEHGKGLQRTSKVGSYQPNSLGLYDMHGNVWEWCDDTEKWPDGAALRVNRGGGWNCEPESCRAVRRQPFGGASPPSDRHSVLGLRLARVPSGAPSPEAKAPPVAIAPFDAAQAKKHQDDWAKHLGVEVAIGNSIGMKLRLVPPGEFMMGSTPKEIEKLLMEEREQSKFLVNAEGPQRSVRISSPFYMGTFEVTQAEYFRVTGANPSDFSKTGKAAAKVGGLDTDRFPVENVNWDEAVAFCQKLSDLPAERAAGRSYRLATEAQWEYACRAGTVGRFSTGDELKETDANFNKVLARTAAVGSFPANAFGLHDLHGNVFEWCQDWFTADYRDLPSVDPQGPAMGEARVVRGADYGYIERYCRSASRDRFQSLARRGGIGFRVVLVGTLKAAPAEKKAPPKE